MSHVTWIAGAVRSTSEAKKSSSIETAVTIPTATTRQLDQRHNSKWQLSSRRSTPKSEPTLPSTMSARHVREHPPMPRDRFKGRYQTSDTTWDSRTNCSLSYCACNCERRTGQPSSVLLQLNWALARPPPKGGILSVAPKPAIPLSRRTSPYRREKSSHAIG